MNKYIDSEKLKTEIERRRKFHDDAIIKFCNNRTIALTHSAGLKEDEEIVELIDSLQQEQPAFITDDSLGSPDYERGFSHGRDFQLECDLKKTDQEKVKAFLINKGYPINTNGDIPTYNETFNLVKRAIEHAKYQE